MHRKFLVITQVFTPDPAAVGQFFDEATQAIASTGAKVTILTANRGYDDPGLISRVQKFAMACKFGAYRCRRLGKIILLSVS